MLSYSPAEVLGRMRPGMEILADLDAFYIEYRRCGELESEISEAEPLWIMMSCTCGAELVRRMSEEKFLDR